MERQPADAEDGDDDDEQNDKEKHNKSNSVEENNYNVDNIIQTKPMTNWTITGC